MGTMTDLLTLRDSLAATAPVTFEVVVNVWGGEEPDLGLDNTRMAFFAVWAMLRYEWADAMLQERNK